MLPFCSPTQTPTCFLGASPHCRPLSCLETGLLGPVPLHQVGMCSRSGTKLPRCTVTRIHVSIQHTLIEHLHSPGPGGISTSRLFPFPSPSSCLGLSTPLPGARGAGGNHRGHLYHPPFPPGRASPPSRPLVLCPASCLGRPRTLQHSILDMASSRMSGHFRGVQRLKVPSHQGPIWLATLLAPWPLLPGSNFSSGEALGLSQGAGNERCTAEVLLGVQGAPFLGGTKPH